MEEIEMFESFIKNIDLINKVIQKIKFTQVEEYGLKVIHVMCLFYLHSNEEGLTSKELTHITLEDKAAISRAISLLEEKEYVIHSKKYKTKITLTEKGKKVANEIAALETEAFRAGRKNISDEKGIEFIHLLDNIANNLTEYYHTLLELNNV